MRTLAAGNKPRRLAQAHSGGFTLLELLVVVTLIAIATAGVSLSMRDSADSALDRDADRLAALLETARAQARASGLPVVWRTDGSGFVFEGLPAPGLPKRWLSDTTRTETEPPIVLGPEPLIAPQAIALNTTTSTRTVWVVTDGLRPFKVQSTRTGLAP